VVRRVRTVLTTGAFDIIHPGHVRLLEKAKALGGKGSQLVVVLATDETVRRNKKREPVFGERARMKLVASLKPVDEVLVGFRPFSFGKVLKHVRPDIVVFGHDQQELRKQFLRFCRERGLSIRTVTFPMFRMAGLNSSTDVVKRVLRVAARMRH